MYWIHLSALDGRNYRSEVRERGGEGRGGGEEGGMALEGIAYSTKLHDAERKSSLDGGQTQIVLQTMTAC